MLAALPDAFELAVWSELKVTDAQVDEFADAESGLDAQVQQEPVAATEPGPGVRGSDERLCFGAVRNDTSVVWVRFAGIVRTWLIVAIASGAR